MYIATASSYAVVLKSYAIANKKINFPVTYFTCVFSDRSKLMYCCAY